MAIGADGCSLLTPAPVMSSVRPFGCRGRSTARSGEEIRLVEADGSRVELVRAFTPGIANGLHKGVVKITTEAGDAKGQMYEVTAICSVKGEPNWPTYDNVFGDPISDLNAKRTFPVKDRWQFLFHFDGRTEKTGRLEPSGWVSRLKDNLCRKGDFDDT
jgi:hypothetical protein